MIRIALATGVVALALAGCGAATDTSPAATATLNPVTTAPTHPTAPPTAAPPTAAPAPTTLFHLAGSGIKTTVNFTTPDEWTLNYTFDCANAGGSGNFIVSENNADGSPNLGGASVNELAAKGGSSTAVHNDAGSHNLGIISECAWTVTAVSA